MATGNDMARNKLTETKIKALSKAGIYSDGDGLYLRVRSGGSKQWFFIYKRAGKRTEIGLGGYGQGTAPVSLALAREKADAIRARLAAGEDLGKSKTFLEVMQDVIDIKHASFKNEKHRDQWVMTLREYAKPLHKKPIADITRDDVVETLKPIWTKIPETADRTRMRIQAVIDHAKARGLYVGNNPADWRGGLKELLPARKRGNKHHPAVKWKDLPEVIAKLRKSVGVSARAAEFLALTCARSSEGRELVWSEIDFDEAVWICPAERMKSGKEHRVPLSDRALAILESQKQLTTGDMVFEGGKEGTAISDTAMTKSLRAASADKTVTLHGLRSTFRDWAGDATAYPRDVAEAALAHSVGDAVEKAYRRGDALDKRRTMMEEWSRYCESKVSTSSKS